MQTLWKVTCMEDVFPGMWQRWFQNQCVALGWGKRGYKLNGQTKGGRGWLVARKAIKDMVVGDLVIVALRGHRIGRLGEITGKSIEDDQWEPLVPPGPGVEDGDMGRRILVRWDLTVGPDDTDLVVRLPEGCTLSNGELRPTVARVYSQSIKQIKAMMNNPMNWVGLMGRFGYEAALSDYIASYPHRLEDGLLPHPHARIRELVFDDRSRLDVLLIDRAERPVIVECKQHSPTVENVRQLRHYIKRLRKETGQKARGILVHGGSQIVPADVRRMARKSPVVEIVSYRLEVDFARSTAT